MNIKNENRCKVKVVPTTALILMLAIPIIAVLSIIFALPLLSHLHFWISTIIIFIILLSGCILPFVLLYFAFPFQYISLDMHGLNFERKGRILYSDIESYDTDAFDFEKKGRLYLYLRPKYGPRMRLTPAPTRDDRDAFYKGCMQFRKDITMMSTSGDGHMPVQRSFYGSPLARALGITFIATELIVILATLTLNRGMIFYALLLAAIGTPIFLKMAMGRRSN